MTTKDQKRPQLPRRAIRLPREVLYALRHEARRRGLAPAGLAEEILRIVVTDDLYAAVIDR